MPEVRPAPLPREPIIEARLVEKFYGTASESQIQVIAPTDLRIYPDEIVAILGPSGSGKSTLLRMLTGLSQPSAGEVFWHGKPLRQAEANVAIVFQSFALFPWLTVAENVEAPLIARGVQAEERRNRSIGILDTVGLDGFESAYPKELSGGMKQRVGFARALVVQPEVLFMDEPFSALDVLTTENLRSELLELWQLNKIPTKSIVIVTHNIEEAVLLADRIVVLGKNPGKIRTDFKVDILHPRDRKDHHFLAYIDYIYKVLTQPHGDVSAVPSTEPKQVTGAKPKYQMLPHARPGGMAGLLEILIDKPGPTDFYKLADDLLMELDDLLPIVEAAQLLGFLKLQEGDVEVTPEGQQFANAEILVQKEMFRTAALDNVTLLKQIVRALETKSDHTVRSEFFEDLLEEYFSDEEVARQLDTAISWGRYAELFDYDAKSKRFFIAQESQDEVTAGAAASK